MPRNDLSSPSPGPSRLSVPETSHHPPDLDVVSSEHVASSGVASRLSLIADRFDGLRDRPRAGSAIGAVCLVAAAALWWMGRPVDPPMVELTIPLASEVAQDQPEPDPAAGESSTASSVGPRAKMEQDLVATGDEASVETVTDVVVHVSGGVARQGLVTLPSTARIADALSAAGGPTGDADPHRLNLAAPVADGQHIHVPLEGEEPDQPLVEGGDNGGGIGVGVGSEASGLAVNVNTADQARLETLPGVGPATARAIIDWRGDNGRFDRVEDLLLVSGIGPAKLELLRDMVVT